MSCAVCGGIPASYRYGAIVCGACKAFYVRWCGETVKRERCYLGGHCQITSTRRPCKPCRYEKCIQVGMLMPNQESLDNGSSYQPSSTSRRPSPYSYPNLTEPSGMDGACRTASSSGHHPLPSISGQNHDSCKEKERWMYEYQQWVRRNRDGMPTMVQPQPKRPRSNSSSQSSRQSVIIRQSTPLSGSASSRRTAIVMHGLSLSEEHVNDSSFIEASELSIIQAVAAAPLFKCFLVRQYSGYTEMAEAVKRATDSVFGDQLQAYTNFMDHGEIPHQPQTSLEGITQEVQNSVKIFVNRMFDFALCLPGFSELNQESRAELFHSKWGVFWMIFYSFFWKNNDFFYLLGENQYHYGRYWLTIMNAGDPKRVSFISSFAETLTSIGLDQTETFLLLAVTLLKTENISDSSHLSLLHRRYLDAMLHIISWRRTPQSGISVIRKLDHMFSRIRMSEKLHMANCIYHLDLASLDPSFHVKPVLDSSDKKSTSPSWDALEAGYDPFSPMQWSEDLV
ncbi:hypothetical protein BV898_09524 [Hypsibius exemplaris]|uniref:Nuclear receptor domain-containing protein n=1 Tax=Hypsibius exemplaris TaxID=2072580 RepID=A0A1W0WMD6_HYPEX|nr:hypothetical protein BV898_09524 [Hypsibius exemplaris]